MRNILGWTRTKAIHQVLGSRQQRVHLSVQRLARSRTWPKNEGISTDEEAPWPKPEIKQGRLGTAQGWPRGPRVSGPGSISSAAREGREKKGREGIKKETKGKRLREMLVTTT